MLAVEQDVGWIKQRRKSREACGTLLFFWFVLASFSFTGHNMHVFPCLVFSPPITLTFDQFDRDEGRIAACF